MIEKDIEINKLMYNKYSIYIYRIKDILVDSLYIVQAIYRVTLYTNSDYQRRK